MQQVFIVKLVPTPEQDKALLAVMETFNATCNWMAEVAFAHSCTNQFKLQKLVYREARNRFGLSSQTVCLAICKVIEAYKRDKKTKPTFRPHGSITYDRHTYSFKGLEKVSLLTLTGRVIVPIRFGAYQAAMLDRKRGQADLVYRDGTFYLSVLVDAPEPTPEDSSEFLGVDLGIVNIATTSDGQMFSGKAINNVRARYARLRTKLQKKGTKSTKRLLKKRSGKERRFQRDRNHCISKALVTQAIGTSRGIALEDLKGIRERITVGKGQRRVIHSWAFGQLRSFIEYKARMAGVKVIAVDPRYTSQACSVCGCVDKANRPSQAVFSCTSCGYRSHADYNAACVIAARAGQPCHAA